MFLEGMIILATMFANVSVPVVPDPNYLQQLYPQSQIITPYEQQQQQFNNLQAPVTQQELTTATNTQPTDLAGFISLAVTAGLGYFMQKQKTSTDRRTYMAADTTLKLAQNNQSSDAKVVKLTYAVSCLADIIGKYHKEEMETYQTIEGVSIWTYIESLNIENNEDFQAKYVRKPPVAPTGTQSKDKVVSTFNQVQQMVTPIPASAEIPNTTKTGGTARIGVNKGAQASASSTVGEPSQAD